MPPPQAHVAVPWPSPRLDFYGRPRQVALQPPSSVQRGSARSYTQLTTLPAASCQPSLGPSMPTRQPLVPQARMVVQQLLGLGLEARHPQVRPAPWRAPGATAVTGRPGPASAGQSRSQRPRRAAAGQLARGEAGGEGGGGEGRRRRGGEAAGDDADDADSWAPQGSQIRTRQRASPPPGYSVLHRRPRCCLAPTSTSMDPGTSARSRHNVLACRSGAPAAEQPRINGMALWPVGNLLWPTLGAFAYSIE